MKKKPTKHFVPVLDRKAPPGKGNGGWGGIPAGNCFGTCLGQKIPAWIGFGDIARTRRGVTCGRCRRTRVYRKPK